MKLKILLLDIETAPKKAYVWGKWKQNIGSNQFISDWYMLSWRAKWLGEKTVFGDVVSGKESLAEDDRRIMQSIWRLMNEADVIVAHNGDRFDIPSINTRFVLNGLTPPAPYKQVDTLKAAKSKFKFTSNKLDDLGKFLGVGRKIDTGGFELWEKCRNGDEKALSKMYKYNKQDVLLLEDVYIKLLPYIPHHPNHSVVKGDGCCTRCGSSNIKLDGTFSTNVSTFDRYRCIDCGSWARGRKNKRSKEEMAGTLMGV